MAFIALSFEAEAGAAELWSDALLEAGALSVDIADPGAGTARETPVYDEPGAAGARWPIGRVTALFPEGADASGVLRRAGMAIGSPVPEHEIRGVADLDWVRATQAQFEPIPVAGRLWIVPSWCAPPDSAAVVVTLDPGLAFGTGSHPTTRLCLEWLAGELRPGASVLDYGCGSGILAIAAAKLGAARVVGVDVDAQAVAASRANAQANGVAVTFAFPEGVPDGRMGRFDVLVANILANPLALLAPAFAVRVRAGGTVVLSGILAEQAEEVAAAYEPWFIISVWKSGDGGWVALAGTRRDESR
jgi:ribosomal protein L11 methyltransferase